MTYMNNVSTTIDIEVVAEDAIFISWPEQVAISTNEQVAFIAKQLSTKYQDEILDIIVSYCSLMILLDLTKTKFWPTSKQIHLDIEQWHTQYYSADTKTALSGKTVHIDVYYSIESGWDMARAVKSTGLSIAQIIALHTATTYRVFANGFTPGFSYLGIVDPQLQLPRLATPRTLVPQGAVAIAEQQTAIYPKATPGGWHILGQSAQPLLIGDRFAQTPLLSVGDTVQFRSIDFETFVAQGGVVAHNPTLT